MADKLNETTAADCAAQLVAAIEALQAKHGWSAGDTLAVSALAFTELVARAVGPSAAAAFFRDHANGIDAEHRRRATL
jgi:hypothetical protein